MKLMEVGQFDALIGLLQEQGYRIVGPTVRQGAVIYDEIQGVEELARGVTDEHGKGSYRIHQNGDARWFAAASGPRSLKHFLIPPRRMLWRARGSNSDFVVELPEETAPRFAFVGVRPCDLSAIALQDQIFIHGPYPDPEYKARREQALLIAVNCLTPSANCFCESTGTGPLATTGYDVLLTEVLEGNAHYFTADAGSATGTEMLTALGLRDATDCELAAAETAALAAVEKVTRQVDLKGLQAVLYDNAESAHWDTIAARCLSCANCTMTCPTCFCATVEDNTDLTGETAERWRVWDSCFTMDFSYIHGGSVRKTTAARYRQWLTHKFAAWQDQFGKFGCVGCGRCITWCPGAIDVTEELAALREARGVRVNGAATA